MSVSIFLMCGNELMTLKSTHLVKPAGSSHCSNVCSIRSILSNSDDWCSSILDSPCETANWFQSEIVVKEMNSSKEVNLSIKEHLLTSATDMVEFLRTDPFGTFYQPQCDLCKPSSFANPPLPPSPLRASTLRCLYWRCTYPGVYRLWVSH